MADHLLGQGILFYATIYISGILFVVFMITGRWIFLLFIVLTYVLSAYVNYTTLTNSDHLKKVGSWSENLIKSTYSKITNYFQKGNP